MGYSYKEGGQQASVRGSSKEKEGEGKKRKGGKEKRKGGKERRKEGKERRKKEEKRRRKGRKRGKRKRKMKECCTVRRPKRQITRNCATRGRFSPTLVILRLGARVMAYGFRSIFWENLYVVWFVCDCVMVKDIVFRDYKIPSRMANGGVPKFPHTLVNRPRQLWTTITFSSELRFARS